MEINITTSMDAEKRYVADAYGIIGDTPLHRVEMTFPDGGTMTCNATTTEIARMLEQQPGTTWRRISSKPNPTTKPL